MAGLRRAQGPVQRRPSPMIPTRTVTVLSLPPSGLMNFQTISSPSPINYLPPASAAMAEVVSGRQRRWSAAASSIEWCGSWAAAFDEDPVGFKWFTAGLFRRLVLLRRRGECRSELPAARRFPCGRPDKDGLIMDLLAARNHCPARARIRGRALPRSNSGTRHIVLTRALTLQRRPEPGGAAASEVCLPESCQGIGAGGRADNHQAD